MTSLDEITGPLLRRLLEAVFSLPVDADGWIPATAIFRSFRVCIPYALARRSALQEKPRCPSLIDYGQRRVTSRLFWQAVQAGYLEKSGGPGFAKTKYRPGWKFDPAEEDVAV